MKPRIKPRRNFSANLRLFFIVHWIKVAVLLVLLASVLWPFYAIARLDAKIFDQRLTVCERPEGVGINPEFLIQIFDRLTGGRHRLEGSLPVFLPAIYLRYICNGRIVHFYPL